MKTSYCSVVAKLEMYFEIEMPCHCFSVWCNDRCFPFFPWLPANKINQLMLTTRLMMNRHVCSLCVWFSFQFAIKRMNTESRVVIYELWSLLRVSWDIETDCVITAENDCTFDSSSRKQDVVSFLLVSSFEHRCFKMRRQQQEPKKWKPWNVSLGMRLQRCQASTLMSVSCVFQRLLLRSDCAIESSIESNKDCVSSHGFSVGWLLCWR